MCVRSGIKEVRSGIAVGKHAPLAGGEAFVGEYLARASGKATSCHLLPIPLTECRRILPRTCTLPNLPNSLSNSEPRMYADDTHLACPNKDICSIQASLNRDLSNMNHWLTTASKLGNLRQGSMQLALQQCFTLCETICWNGVTLCKASCNLSRNGHYRDKVV